MQDMEMVSMEQSGEELSACVFASVCVYETEKEGGRGSHRLYLELLLGPLKRYTAMHSGCSVYRRTLALLF